MSTVGTSFMIRKKRCGRVFRSAAKSLTHRAISPCMAKSPRSPADLARNQPLHQNPPAHASHTPASSDTTIAGVMMALRSRRSITLKVSDCTDPVSASVWYTKSRGR